MNGFKAFKYYTAIRLHFTSPKFNVFVNRGHVKGSYQAYTSRNDYSLFEKLARMFGSDKELIQYLASNFMYGNPDVVYDPDLSMINYKEFLKRRQSITRIFADDLDTIIQSGAQYQFSGLQIPDVLQLLMAKRITLETLVILDTLDGIVDKMKQSSHMSLLLGDDLHRIEKSRGFVKFDSERIKQPYSEFVQEVESNHHG